MTEKGEKLLAVAAFLFAALFIGSMILVRNMDVNARVAEQIVSENDIEAESIREEYFETIELAEADIVIPLPEGLEDTVEIREIPLEKRIEIVMGDEDESFFHRNKIQGNEEKISSVFFSKVQGQTSLVFMLSHFYETETEIVGNEIRMTLENPADVYDRMIVLDDTFAQWEERIDGETEPYHMKAFVSGNMEEANGIRADCFVSLQKEIMAETGDQTEDATIEDSGAENEVEIVIYYNDDYFIPEFSSGDLAQVLMDYFLKAHETWNISISRSNDSQLSQAMIPAVKVVCTMPAQAVEDKEEETGNQWDESIEKLTIDALLDQFQGMDEGR